MLCMAGLLCSEHQLAALARSECILFAALQKGSYKQPRGKIWQYSSSCGELCAVVSSLELVD